MRRCLKAAKAGCANWQPYTYPPGETEESVKIKEYELRVLSGNLESFSDEQFLTLKAYFELTYRKQRVYLNSISNIPIVAQIQETFAFLSFFAYFYI